MNLPEQINNLPKPIRDYIHNLETACPADLVQENANLRENQKALLRMNKMSDLEKIKEIADQMPDSPEKEQALQAYENLKTFEQMADAFDSIIVK